MEERLWNYIDGSCSDDEFAAVALLIEQNKNWQNAYQEMLQFNEELAAVSPDEPSMAFSYKVMEGIRAHEASKPLKTTINKYLIGSIAAFFVLSIIGLTMFVFSGTPQTIENYNAVAYNNLPDLNIFANSTVINIFLYLDAILLLFFVDAWLRKGGNNTKIKSV